MNESGKTTNDAAHGHQREGQRERTGNPHAGRHLTDPCLGIESDSRKQADSSAPFFTGSHPRQNRAGWEPEAN